MTVPRTVEETAARLGVDPRTGLTAREAAERAAAHGPNRLAQPARRPEWLRFLDQFRNWLIGILLIAAVVAAAIGEVRDAVVITVVLQINAVLGYLQERRAERSLEALRRMLVPTARVRRDGTEREVAAEALVPGDVVLLEAGDRVPADGRLLVAESVEVAEAALTGESQPVPKTADPPPAPAGTGPVPLAERTGELFMNTALTRGRAELVVTAIGMDTELGAIAEALRSGGEPPSPLQVQLDSLGRRLAVLSGVAVGLYAVLALLRGEAPSDIALRAVALAVAAIPEGLPAVLALTLALGVHRMARRGAVVRRLASVEALGSATVVCSDKTGTLTLNEMTVRSVWTAGRRYAVTGEGYGTRGTVVRADGSPADSAEVRAGVLPFALCNDARLTGDGFVGDPTEAALLVLAAKAGTDPDALRAERPRTGELPFDAATKYMATFHTEPGGRTRAYVKGAADVLLDRCATVLTEDGVRPLDEPRRAAVRAVTAGLGRSGLRVLAAATALVDGPAGPVGQGGVDGHEGPTGLTLVAVAGLADPPRPQARAAMDLCRTAGVAVKMITGDHADTAAAVAREVGITGEVVTGADLDRMPEGELTRRVEGIGVFARVAPEHKVAVVRALTARGHVVAMTGDGVNDAAALRAAHIGVAMGRTGTDVAKEAADLVLTDDDFSTIVRAVREGRAIYANIVKFVRFQLATNIGALLTLLGASAAGLPAPLTATQLLWVNIIMDGPPAMALAVDPAGEDIMRRPPRDPAERILNARRLLAVGRAGAVMAVGTVTLFALARPRTGDATAATMAFTAFVLFQLVNSLCARAEDSPLLGRHQLTNRTLWLCLAGVLAVQVAAVHLPWARSVFGTVPLTAAQWAVCTAVASTVLLAEAAVRAATAVRGRRHVPDGQPSGGAGAAAAR
ncbi:cation-translocating P-type ATPase [Streptomyces sp. bgisy159]|uniref:cation-translocating P-type ATPase n=1 Tax=Streptomyces sp. bgisy159 TaxID=3413795 RepID=UPI003F4A4364